MKNILKTVIFFVFISLTVICSAQETTYHDKKGKKISDEKEAFFSRKFTKDPNSEFYIMTELYMDDRIKRKVKTKSRSNSSSRNFEGEVIAYYPNGQIESKVWYTDGNTKGPGIYYYENGNLKKEIRYSGQNLSKMNGEEDTSIPDTLISFFDIHNNQLVNNGNGYLNDQNGEDYTEGSYKDGVKVGQWKGTFSKGKYAFTENYEAGKLITGVSIDSTGKQYNYTALEMEPHYGNDINSLRQAVVKNYRYPRQAVVAEVQGTIRIEFVVNQQGDMVDIKIKEDLGYGTGAAAIEALEAAQKQHKWSPGRQRGIPVKVAYTLPIRLNMSSGSSSTTRRITK